jgi:hypothetical protein
LVQALAAVNADPKLNMARFCLVPTYIKEGKCNLFCVQCVCVLYSKVLDKKTKKTLEEFWRNWFYRVQIILTAYGLEMPKKNTKKISHDNVLPSTASHSPILSVEDSLSNKIEKELGELGIHTSESNPEAWEEELKRELSSLDPSKEASDSLLSQNWEEELMLELGLKNSPGLHKDSHNKQTTDKILPISEQLQDTNIPPAHVETKTHAQLALAATTPSISETNPLESTTTNTISTEHTPADYSKVIVDSSVSTVPDITPSAPSSVSTVPDITPSTPHDVTSDRPIDSESSSVST